MENKTIQLYKKKGQAVGAVNAIITLVVGIGVAVMVLIFVGALGGAHPGVPGDQGLVGGV